MPESVLTAAYLAAGALFILSLNGLSTQETARRGNLFGIVGMALAVAATALHPKLQGYLPFAVTLLAGGAVGLTLAGRVAMTSMPQLVAMLHSFVGLAAVLVGVSTYLDAEPLTDRAAEVVHLLEIWIGVAVGALTFTGSVVAWAKLDGRISGKPLLLPGRHALNVGMVLALVGLLAPFMGAEGHSGILYLVVNSVIAAILGVHLVMAIGGADMPVVVSLLNSYSGWAAAAAGFMLSNDLLIVTGALVGSSGAILSYIMCKAMNRSIWNVVFGGFGTDGGAPAQAGAVQGELTPIEVEELRELLCESREVIIVPGYGMAVARAQHPVHELTRQLQARGVRVRYAIHPVAGRLPGHMNVLLAEAGVPYDIVLEMDEINEDMASTDVVLVIGANDIVNPGALEDPTSPIYGMPVLEVWKARHVIVSKRGRGAGYAGVENPLFFRENTQMFFGDARDSVEKLVGSLRAAQQ